MINSESIRRNIRSKYIKFTHRFRRKCLKYEDFSIISNNCWAGLIYQSYGLPYNTPTVGMFIMPEDFNKFVSNLSYYLSIEKLIEVKPSESKWFDIIKNRTDFGKYPIASLGDIELHLLHFKSVEEAQEKWNRRKARVNYDRILYKFSAMNDCLPKDIADFQKINVKNKICFVSNMYRDLANNYTFIVDKSDSKSIKYSKEPFGKSRIVNINRVINTL